MLLYTIPMSRPCASSWKIAATGMCQVAVAGVAILSSVIVKAIESTSIRLRLIPAAKILGVAYRAEHLSGVGMIDGYQVRCVAPDWMVKFHTGYPLDKNDFSDVKALCEKFEIEMPEEHQAYWRFLEENNIRSETINDQDAIREIHRLAFGGPAEAKLVEDLRQSGDAVISLVAERDSRIIGHVLFSKLKAPMKALGLAPVAVHPSFQKQGVGLALIRDGLDQAKEDGWTCVFVLGDPAYYGRFGFRVEAAKGYSSPYSGGHFMAVPFSDVPKSGEIVYPMPFKLLDQ
jgi:putative acetyltransferase